MLNQNMEWKYEFKKKKMKFENFNLSSAPDIHVVRVKVIVVNHSIVSKECSLWIEDNWTVCGISFSWNWT